MYGKYLYLGEVPQHFRHFISTLSAAHVDNDVAVGILGQRLRDHRLPAAEGAGYGGGAALHASVRHKGHAVSCEANGFYI